MRLMFVARALGGMAGGVERMITTIMDAMVARGHQVDLLTWDQAGTLSFYPMAEDITWHKLDMGDPGLKAGWRLKLRRGISVRALVRQVRPDAIVCFQDGPFMAIRAYLASMSVPVIAAERNAPTRFDHTRAAWRQNLTYTAFRFAKRILIQNASYRELYPKYLHDRIFTIPNPVFPTTARAIPGQVNPQDRFRLLSVGRLSYQKNYPVLIEAFARLQAEYPDWELVVVGEGEKRSELETLIAQYGLTDRVTLPGAHASISDWYVSAHVFCLPSRWEGFPNALAEALATGLPCVGFNGCAGVRDLIKHEENGLLADGNGNLDNLRDALSKLMSSPAMRETMSKAAVESVDSYDPETIFSLWERVLSEVINT